VPNKRQTPRSGEGRRSYAVSALSKQGLAKCKVPTCARETSAGGLAPFLAATIHHSSILAAVNGVSPKCNAQFANQGASSGGLHGDKKRSLAFA
jgi:hypothetical protein